MSNFNERIQSVVDAKFGEMLDLFQASEDRTGDLIPKIDRLLAALPLIQDIKTEVASCEKALKVRPKDKDEKEDNKRDPQTNQPGDPHKQNELIEFLKQLIESLDGIGFDGILEIPDIPLPALPGGSGGPDIDLLKILKFIWDMGNELKKDIFQSIIGHLSEAEWKSLRSQIDYINMATNKIKKILEDDVKNGISGLSDKMDQLNQALEDCCDQQSSYLDDIKRKLDQFEPQADMNKDLSLQTKTKAILSEIQTIRGFL